MLSTVNHWRNRKFASYHLQIRNWSQKEGNSWFSSRSLLVLYLLYIPGCSRGVEVWLVFMFWWWAHVQELLSVLVCKAPLWTKLWQHLCYVSTRLKKFRGKVCLQGDECLEQRFSYAPSELVTQAVYLQSCCQQILSKISLISGHNITQSWHGPYLGVDKRVSSSSLTLVAYFTHDAAQTLKIWRDLNQNRGQGWWRGEERSDVMCVLWLPVTSGSDSSSTGGESVKVSPELRKKNRWTFRQTGLCHPVCQGFSVTTEFLVCCIVLLPLLWILF